MWSKYHPNYLKAIQYVSHTLVVSYNLVHFIFCCHGYWVVMPHPGCHGSGVVTSHPQLACLHGFWVLTSQLVCCVCITDRKWLEYFIAHNDIQSIDEERLTVVNLIMIVVMHCIFQLVALQFSKYNNN